MKEKEKISSYLNFVLWKLLKTIWTFRWTNQNIAILPKNWKGTPIIFLTNKKLKDFKSKKKQSTCSLKYAWRAREPTEQFFNKTVSNKIRFLRIKMQEMTQKRRDKERFKSLSWVKCLCSRIYQAKFRRLRRISGSNANLNCKR